MDSFLNKEHGAIRNVIALGTKKKDEYVFVCVNFRNCGDKLGLRCAKFRLKFVCQLRLS